MLDLTLYMDTRVRVTGVISDRFEIGVRVHQGSALSPPVFIFLMEETTKEQSVGELWPRVGGGYNGAQRWGAQAPGLYCVATWLATHFP